MNFDVIPIRILNELCCFLIFAAPFYFDGESNRLSNRCWAVINWANWRISFLVPQASLMALRAIFTSKQNSLCFLVRNIFKLKQFELKSTFCHASNASCLRHALHTYAPFIDIQIERPAILLNDLKILFSDLLSTSRR